LEYRLTRLSERRKEKIDEIEMDEIFTYVKKLQRAVIWTAYSRRQKRVIAYEISNEGISSCLRTKGYSKDVIKNNKLIYPQTSVRKSKQNSYKLIYIQLRNNP
jgi:hypothetical protein